VTPSDVAAEQRARQFLAQSKWRKARDELKPLVKLDRERYLPLLIDANVGLARDMIARGQVSEAQQVLAYLATIAPADRLRGLEVEMAAKRGASEESSSRFLAALADPSPALSDAERVRLADVLVLAFQPPPPHSPAQERIAAELQAVLDALEAVCSGGWDKASAALRTIAHRSPFRHWAMFVKGVMGFHRGDLDRAEKCLDALPPNSVTAKAAEVYLLLAGRRGAAPGGKPMTEASIEAVCRLVGTPGLGGLVLRADQAWQEGHHAESYQMFREMVAQFPSGAPNWLGALTGFYFQAPHGMAVDSREQYVHLFDRMISRRGFKNGVEEMLVLRMFALLDGDVMPACALREDWEGYLRQHERLHGPNPRFASLAYGWLGEKLAAENAPTGFFFGRQRGMRDAAGAVETLRRSIELDPENLPAHLALCTVYGALKQTSERNRLLDTMTQRFPDDKQVLLRAAEGCLARKAFVKGLDYLARARQLDALDPLVLQLLAISHRRLARQHFQQHRPDKARQVLAQLDQWLVDSSDDFHRSRWTARALDGLMELRWGDPVRGEAWLTQARGMAPGVEAFLLFAHLGHRVYSNTSRCASPFLAEFKQQARRSASVRGVAGLLRILDFWKESPDELDVLDEEALVSGVLKAAVKRPFTQTDALDLIHRAQGRIRFESQVRNLVKQVLRRDALDPQFRLLDLELSAARGYGQRPCQGQLQAILDEALRRHDEATMRKVRELLRRRHHPPDPLMPPDIDFDAPDEEDEEFEDDGAPDFADLLPPGQSPEQLNLLAQMLETLRQAPDWAIGEIRKTLAKDLPGPLFDVLVQLAKSGLPLPSRPEQPVHQPRKPNPLPPKPKPLPPPPDPNQMTLF
jgi:thioredoxin-like negative regulator of GroEL